MAYDVSRLSSADSARTYMQNVLAKGDMKQHDAAFRRLCELEGRNHDDPLERDFWKAIAALEEILRVKRGRRVLASRTRQKIARVGVLRTVGDLALTTKPSEGFGILVEGGFADLTAEYLVIRHAHRFTEDVVSGARARLEQAGVAPPAEEAA